MTQAAPPSEPNFIHSRGMKFPDDPAILRGRIRKLLRQNAYEAKESEAALRVVREGDRVIELGGGVGYMSTLVASKRNVASVHSFEANPNLIPYIRRVHAANGLSNTFLLYTSDASDECLGVDHGARRIIKKK